MDCCPPRLEQKSTFGLQVRAVRPRTDFFSSADLGRTLSRLPLKDPGVSWPSIVLQAYLPVGTFGISWSSFNGELRPSSLSSPSLCSTGDCTELLVCHDLRQQVRLGVGRALATQLFSYLPRTGRCSKIFSLVKPIMRYCGNRRYLMYKVSLICR